jgi:CRISPR-associated protein Cmr4
VVIPDEHFAMLVRRLPVRARIRLNEDKTTSGNGGNLWYEEHVPSDCLFVSMIGARRGRGDALRIFREHGARLEVSQIGGNETVGEGICFWALAPQAASAKGPL